MQDASITLQRRLEPEDQARADCYALLAALFGAPPGRDLLAAIGGSPRLAGATPIAEAYNRMLDASGAVDPAAAEQEYVDLFIGVGKSEVDPHAAHWCSEPGSRRSLAALRAELAEMNLARRPQSALYENHFAALCETMRLLVAGAGDCPPLPITEQRAFFDRHLAGWSSLFCDAICKSPLANYYARVAEFTRLFMALERDSLAME